MLINADYPILIIRALMLTTGLLLSLGATATPDDTRALATDTTEMVQALEDARLRAAIAEAERAALLDRLPPASAKPLPGAVETRQFGAAGLVRAFDLAGELAREVCAALPAGPAHVVYDPAATQGVVAARTVAGALDGLGDEMARRNRELQAYIDKHTPPGAALTTLSTALTVVPAILRAAADTASLFKSDVTVAGLAYGDGARGLFATSLAASCPDRIAGLGGGYLGELDTRQHERLLGKLRALANHRAEYANRIALLQKLADNARGDEKRELAAVAGAAGAALKAVDAFIESLRAGETGERSPLYNAARYLAYAARIDGAQVLDFDLRLEGMSIVKDGLFSGQKLRLSAVALLWYRVHAPDGSLRLARTARRMLRPIEVDLRGAEAEGTFWSGGEATPARPR
ncbi:hypothetical protein [Massilia sp. GCM10023247]|uniref:hypothetical protein n=1 Tax=Massilia sp. GCM10023247 TaxID=3252643 RepID=UPI003612123F